MGHSIVFTFTCRYQNKSEQTGAEGGSQGPGLLPPPEHLQAAVEVGEGDQVPVHDLATGAAIVTSLVVVIKINPPSIFTWRPPSHIILCRNIFTLKVYSYIG